MWCLHYLLPLINPRNLPGWCLSLSRVSSSTFFNEVSSSTFFNEVSSSPLSANTLVMSYESACITFRRNYFIIRVSIDLHLVRILKIGNFRFPSVPSFRDTNYLGNNCRSNCFYRGLYVSLFCFYRGDHPLLFLSRWAPSSFICEYSRNNLCIRLWSVSP